MKRAVCVTALLLLTGVAVAQSADEQLLSAQMAYQQGNEQLDSSAARLQQAQSAKKEADDRLLLAQDAAKKGDSELAAAVAANQQAQQVMEQLRANLATAWQRKNAQ